MNFGALGTQINTCRTHTLWHMMTTGNPSCHLPISLCSLLIQNPQISQMGHLGCSFSIGVSDKYVQRQPQQVYSFYPFPLLGRPLTLSSDGDTPTIVGEFSLSVPDDVQWTSTWNPSTQQAFYSQWFAAQVTKYEADTNGWIFWTWKSQLGDYRWSYQGEQFQSSVLAVVISCLLLDKG